MTISYYIFKYKYIKNGKFKFCLILLKIKIQNKKYKFLSSIKDNIIINKKKF